MHNIYFIFECHTRAHTHTHTITQMRSFRKCVFVNIVFVQTAKIMIQASQLACVCAMR